MSKGTGGQGGGGKKQKKKSGKGGGKPAPPKSTGTPFGTGNNPLMDRGPGMHSQTPYSQANAAGIPRRTSG